MSWAPKILTVWRHIESGAVLVESGTITLRKMSMERSSDWERIHYLQREFDSSSVPMQSVFEFAGPLPECLHDHGVWSEVERCLDPSHEHFWMPANWSGDRAPAKWKMRTPDHDFIGVDLWVRLASGGVEVWGETHFGGALGDRWEPGTMMNDVRTLINLERKVEAERDEHMESLVELVEVQTGSGALPG